MSRPRWQKAAAGLAVGALALATSIAGTAAAGTSTAGSTATPSLWPKLSPFKTMTVANFSSAGATDDQVLAATTLEGAYNQQERSNRLYVVNNPDDQTWLGDGVFKGVKVTQLQGEGGGSQSARQLNALLATYGHSVKGAILINPSDIDTTDLATTMAGIKDAMVAAPNQLPLLKKYGIKVLYSFANQSFASATAAYQWGYTNLFPKTHHKILVMLDPTNYGGIRDYAIATKSFVFFLTTSTDSTSETDLMNQIIDSTPADTPIMGYIPDEGPDVADLSEQGHFLNASDFLDNESDWSTVASISHLTQRKPQALDAQNKTVYVGWLVSDGDNAQYLQHQMFDYWTDDPYLGEVPEGWTSPPGAVDFAPSMLNWFYKNLPTNSELLPGPSGIGYSTQMSGTDLDTFAKLSGAFMKRDSMSTVDYWQNLSTLADYAANADIPSISVDAPLAYLKEGKTVVMGQTSGYLNTDDDVLNTIEQDVLSEGTSGPIFLEPLVNSWNAGPKDILAISQALANWGKTVGEKFIFTTPSQLALTQEAYRDGITTSLPKLNAQTATGRHLLNLPSAGSLQGFTAPTVSGPNLVTNPSGADGTTGWTTSATSTSPAGTLSAGTYNGSSDIEWDVPYTTSSQSWVHYYPAITPGNTYKFSAQVAGTGQVFLDVYDGTQDWQSPPINLTSSYQTLSWVASIPTGVENDGQGSSPQIQVRESGFEPVTVHIDDATVQLATTPSS